MIETHAHIYDEGFNEDMEQMLSRAFEAGVEQIWMPNCNHETIDSMMALAKEYPDKCLPMIGLHPCYVKEDFEKEIQIIEDYLAKEKFIAIGEIGLDLYWDKTFFAQQQEAFLQQCVLAKKHNLWIDIHSRNAFWETVELIEKNGDPNLKGIFHCFTGTLEEAQKAVELGFLLGIGGVATFKNGGLDQVIPHISIDKLVLETDAPYLAPVPYRGKRNEPSYLPLVAQKIADWHQCDVTVVLEKTTQNAKALLG
ncbi:TatD family hydrolase [Flectobacillus sp. BAB-3569]|uniref:TatD family hydrolase n=1 Tax=Flectobacillus sp. BAB-3569 TaxID=1509483 RepID=UPI000BA3FB86|nr:TatD family hydrolase [Flectobacillus sp. BAB-3569]PAC30480.1 hydrolase TatD [Flectobacillus sp. BAB-3569]